LFIYFDVDFSSASGLNKLECGLKPALNPRRRPRRDRPIADFIVGGEEADEGQHPWHASLSTNYGDEDMERYDFCGATLISRRAVLTGILKFSYLSLNKAPSYSQFLAAHCIFDVINKIFTEAAHLSVTLGMRNRFNETEAKNQQILTVTVILNAILKQIQR